MNFVRSLINTENYCMWNKKYQPTCLDDIIGNRALIFALKAYLNNGLPNIILTGPNGSAKTTIANNLVREYLGDHYRVGCLHIDGAINRGKDTISDPEDKKSKSESTDTASVMNFAKTKITLPLGRCKIVVIYNFEHMTKEAQNALRRIIELFAHNTRFILICNEMDSVIEPIQSRCVLLRTTSLTDNELKAAIYRVLDLRNPEDELSEKNPSEIVETEDGTDVETETIISDEVIDTICLISDGDIKKTINYLQVISNAEQPTLDTFYKIFNMPSIRSIKEIIYACQSKSTHNQAYQVVKQLILDGYNANDILDILVKTLIRMDDIFLHTKILYLRAISRCFYKTEIAPSVFHLFSLISILGRISETGQYHEQLI